MSNRCCGQVHLALDAFWTGSREKAARVTDEEEVVDDDEVLLDELVLRVLALRHPVATDLRRLVASFRIVTDLERIGDEAVHLAGHPPVNAPNVEAECQKLRRMGQETEVLLDKAVRSFFDEDGASAREVLQEGEAIEAFYGEVLRDVAGLDPKCDGDGPTRLAILAVARRLERLAARATNIGRATLFVAGQGQMPL
jgi:phosphate transport system protein